MNHKKKPRNNCQICGKKFTKENKTIRMEWDRCDECIRKYYREMNKKRFNTNTHCIICGKRLEPNQKKYCLEHKKYGNYIKNRQYIKSVWLKKHPNYFKIALRKWVISTRNKVMDKIGHKCIFCNTKENIHFHHVIPYDYQSGKTVTAKHYLKYYYLIIPLCASCHYTWHILKEEFEQFIM